MKTIYIAAILLIALSFGCHNSGGHLSINTTDSNTNYTFEASYAESKTASVGKYIDSALNNDLPLDQNIDLFVNLNGTDKFNLKAKKGWIAINFDKRNSSLDSYMKMKKLTEGIKRKLTR